MVPINWHALFTQKLWAEIEIIDDWFDFEWINLKSSLWAVAQMMKIEETMGGKSKPKSTPINSFGHKQSVLQSD